jgi:hypothetical protein
VLRWHGLRWDAAPPSQAAPPPAPPPIPLSPRHHPPHPSRSPPRLCARPLARRRIQQRFPVLRDATQQDSDVLYLLLWQMQRTLPMREFQSMLWQIILRLSLSKF